MLINMQLTSPMFATLLIGLASIAAHASADADRVKRNGEAQPSVPSRPIQGGHTENE